MNLYPIIHGNQARVLELIKGLRFFGYKIILIINQNNYGINPRGKELKKVLNEMKKLCDVLIPLNAGVFERKIESFNVKPYADAVKKAALKYKPMAVIVGYIWMAPCLDEVHDTIKMIDTNDLMYVRKELYSKTGIGPWVICTKKKETSLLKKADVIISIQKHELNKFKQMVPTRKVIYLPHFPGIIKSKPAAKVKNYIMVVGSSNASNKHGIKKFLEYAWPKIVEGIPSIKLHVYGKLANSIPKNIKGVEKIGFVDNLEKAYNEAKLVINPTILGTGLKIKTVEAICYGKALVTTKEGADGIEDGIGRAFVMEKTFPKFAKSIIKLIKDDGMRKSLEKNALKYAQQTFSRKNVFKGLLGVLK